MKRVIEFAFIVIVFLLLVGCQSWDTYFAKPVTSNRDPLLVRCKSTFLIRWEPSTPELTLRQIKVHNESSRRLCPASTYGRLQYYDELFTESPAPSPSKIIVKPDGSTVVESEPVK